MSAQNSLRPALTQQRIFIALVICLIGFHVLCMIASLILEFPLFLLNLRYLFRKKGLVIKKFQYENRTVQYVSRRGKPGQPGQSLKPGASQAPGGGNETIQLLQNTYILDCQDKEIIDLIDKVK